MGLFSCKFKSNMVFLRKINAGVACLKKYFEGIVVID